MEKELQDLLDNYERSIYGKEVPKMPTIHQIHLLLDYIANQCVQLKKQQKIIDRLKELNLTISDSDYIYSQDEIANKNLELLQMLEDKGE